MVGSADEILRQSVIYGTVTVILLSTKFTKLLPVKQRKWINYLRKPILTAILMYLAYVPIATERPNFYTMLEVDVHANKNDILQGYRNVSKKYHPDRVSSSGIVPPLAGNMTPEEYFMEIKKAQEVLTHEIRKSFYDRFGDLKQVGEVDEKIAIMAVCLSIAVHLLCFAVGFLLSHPKEVSYARQYCDVPARHWAVLKALLSTNRVLTERTQELIRAASFLKTMGTPSVAAMKAVTQQQQTLQPAAVRAKAAGMDVASQPASALPSSAAPAVPHNPNLTELENFTARLSEEQREQFKKVIEEQYRRTEQEDRALEKRRARFDINWSQVLMWSSLFVAWLYYK